MIHGSPCLTLRNRASHHEWWTDPAAERGSSHWLSWLGSWCSHQVESGSFPSNLEFCLQARVSCLQLGRKGRDGATEPRREPPGLGTRGGGSCWRAWLQGRHRAPSLNPSDLNLSSYRVSLVTNCPYLKCVSVCFSPLFSLPPPTPLALSLSRSLFFFPFFFPSVFWCLVERTHAPSQPSQQLVPRVLVHQHRPFKRFRLQTFFNFLKVRGWLGERREVGGRGGVVPSRFNPLGSGSGGRDPSSTVLSFEYRVGCLFFTSLPVRFWGRLV